MGKGGVGSVEWARWMGGMGWAGLGWAWWAGWDPQSAIPDPTQPSLFTLVYSLLSFADEIPAGASPSHIACPFEKATSKTKAMPL